MSHYDYHNYDIISNHGVVHHHANLGPYNTHQLLNFLNHMRDALLGQQDEHPIYVVVWDCYVMMFVSCVFHNICILLDVFFEFQITADLPCLAAY